MTRSKPTIAPASFTPGAWTAEDDHLCGCISVFGTDANGRDWTICDMGVPVDLVCEAREDLHPRFIAEQEANANLIVSAPDLYEALSAVLPYLEEGYMDGEDDDEPIGWTADSDGSNQRPMALTFGMIRCARAALAKAKAA